MTGRDYAVILAVILVCYVAIAAYGSYLNG